MSEAIQITAFRQLLDLLEDFVIASRFLGEPMIAVAYMVKRAFEQELQFIVAGGSRREPDSAAFNHMVDPLFTSIREIEAFKNRNRQVDEFYNHLSTISESVVALSWVGVKPAPIQYIRDMRESGEYFGNRVLSSNKGNQRHITWVNKWQEILQALEEYVRKYHLTGFDYGFATRACGTDGRVLEGILVPPPLPPIPRDTVMASGDNPRRALLTQLNQGVSIVRMLRPVKPEPYAPKPQDAAGPSSQQAPAERIFPPKFVLDGRKWRVEHQKDDYSLTINNEAMSESLAMFKCQNVGLEVKNKMNGVTIDNCKRSTVVLHDIISSVELIRCERVKVQCSGHVPLISLDSCDSVQIFLTDNSVDAELISSKSTSLNVCLLALDGDYTELAVPEQIKTVVVNRKLQSTVVEKI